MRILTRWLAQAARLAAMVALCGTAGVVAAGTSAKAAVVTFDGFSAGVFAGGMEDGFTIVTSNATVWEPIYGFPTQSAGTDVINVTGIFSFTAAAPFRFVSIELVDPGFDSMSGPVIAEGYLGAMLLATDVFPLPGIRRVPVMHSAGNLAGLTLDRLVLSTTASDDQTTIFDNVTFASAVAEPAPLALAGAVALGGLVWRRRRHAPEVVYRLG